ncbi:nuclear transport factor 2 family protein [Pseudotenacibaculum haliotis]|uniref:Nuclear transport factor 2 family protein n=1 Tax=Pseudotenacibaculum haliotis TaxID=1862138 RepID=A0ABW5LXJ5_9FLAO
MKRQLDLINLYVQGYNSFNMKKMLLPLHSKVVFENYVKNELTMKLEGLKAFKKQAQRGTEMFSKRKKEILSVEHKDDHCIALVSYRATLKVDVGDKMKKGQEMNINGKSIFFFKDDRISKIEDYS